MHRSPRASQVFIFCHVNGHPMRRNNVAKFGRGVVRSLGALPREPGSLIRTQEILFKQITHVRCSKGTRRPIGASLKITVALMSVVQRRAENICSHRAFQPVTPTGPRTASSAVGTYGLAKAMIEQASSATARNHVIYFPLRRSLADAPARKC